MLVPILTDKVSEKRQDSRLYVFRSGDFLVLPSDFSIDFKTQLFVSKRSRPEFSLRFVRLGLLPLTGSFTLFTTVMAWLLRTRWRLTPRLAVRFRDLLTSNGFNLLYLHDDLYRVSFFRARRFRIRFHRDLPQHFFAVCDVSKLSHTTYLGYDIYFNSK